MAHAALDAFTPQVREWFGRAFERPTPAQEQAWPAIATGAHTLISAPTGSGKTLAAFLWALDRLVAEPSAHRTRLVYVSPLKALSYDVEKNLRAPLRGIGADVKVGIRTGDTPQKDRRDMVRHPPDILITTPESLYLMLTSQARAIFEGGEQVIVDEIHAVAQTKRGAHLAITLERLAEQAGTDLQRIGLSATQNPLEEVGRFLVGPKRTCTVVDTGTRKPLDLEIHVPVESMVEPEQSDLDLDPFAGQEATRKSIWPAIYPELLEQVREHRSTIVFVNNRRAAERLALRLNELAGEPIARAHHGSLAREERIVVEEQLKAGQLPCIVATSSLELGIDMGAVDLVLQVESPKSVTAGLQRIGRSGHGVGDTAKGRIFPKFRADLLECAVVAKRMREGLIERTVVPRNPLDVLAQQIVAMAASSEDPLPVDGLHALVTRTHTYAELSRAQLENVLDMLDGRYPSDEFGELRPRVVWDRVAGTIRARKGARALAITNAGTIPDRGLFSVNLPDGRRVGELDEEMVYEARPGQVFLLGASSWRIEDITRDRVVVTPAPGVPGAVPFWKGDGVGRPRELGEAIGEFARWAVEQDAATLADGYDLDPRAAHNLLAFLREQQDATRVVPSDRAIVVERFRDEIGDWRLCVLSPYGGRVHAAWGLALSARIREQYGLESDAIWSDDGIIVHLPDADQAPGAELVMIEPDELEDAVVGELGGSALFGARFRENAGRALLIPRAYPGRRTPLWQQRLKSQTLLEVAKRYGQFPIVLETYRECLRDVLDVPGLQDLLRKLHARELSVIEVETPTASPFASSLLFDYVATYMYEGDAPNAERRAAALALDRDLLRELLGQEELRDLIDPGALESVEADLQRISERTRADSADALHDVLRRIGDLTLDELRARAVPGADVAAWLEQLRGERRAIVLRVAGEERWIAGEDAGLYRDALGAVPPGGLPAAFLEDVPDAMERLVRRWARTHGPFEGRVLRDRYGLDLTPVLAGLERAGELVRGELRPGGTQREWCDAEVLRRLRRASLAALRAEIEPADQRALARFMPSWQGVDRHSASPSGLVTGGGSAGRLASGAGIDRLREVLVPLQGLALPADVWERDVLPRRTGAYSAAWLDQLCAAGEVVWVGAGPLGRHSGKVALYFRDDAAVLGPPPGVRPDSGEQFAERAHDAIRARLRQGACFFTDLLVEVAGVPAEELQEALWDLVWAGEVTNDAFAPLRSPRGSARWGQQGRADRARRRRFGTRRAGAQPQIQGRWSLTAPLFAGGAGDPAARRRAQAELLLERHGIVTREHVLAEGIPGGFSSLYDSFTALETLGVCQRGYFVEGLGGAQFALPGAAERLRSQRDDEEAEPVVLAATDPAQPYGGVLKWPKREARSPARQAGAHVVLAGAEPVLYVERGGKGLQVLVEEDDERLVRAIEALAAAVQRGRIRRLGVEKVNGDPVIGSPFEDLLLELGFRAGPRKLTIGA
ncbi:MAG TPA: DEAD/DEAH box helicase [Solirubrobacteraceae bacterium]|nr:DEAD/DEAH box helicase [Solirubrobacteraceae bacterium]